jgi:hypothetical protein
VHGDVKTFGLATLPYAHAFLMPPDPYGQGIWNVRLKGKATYGDVLSFEVHHAVNSTLGSPGAATSFAGTGVGLSAPEAIELSWDAALDGDDLSVLGRTDRLVLTASQPGAELTVGRQAIAFGSGLFFSPLDLVNPFSPATIDNEYKPGVDAVRFDGYFGTTGRFTAVGAYAGDWSLDGTVNALYGQGTVGVTDLGGFVGAIHGEPVFGLTAVSGLGPVGLHADATLTLAKEDDAFVRAVAGANHLPTPTTTVAAELYVQTFGATDPADYFTIASSPRFARGEVWSMGRYYGAVSVGQEITPLVSINGALIANLTDPSALLSPSLTWSAANNTSLGLGAFVGLGERPSNTAATSEFGLYPASFFANMSAYF